MSFMICLTLILTFGIATNAKTLTRLLECPSDKLTLTASDLKSVNEGSVVDVYWKARYFHSTDWINVVYCSGSLACILLKQELPDGTQVLSGVNGSLSVKHSAGSNSSGHIQFKLEVHFTDGSVDYHIYEVNFTALCVWAWLDANLNLTRVFLDIYPREEIVDIELYDTNGTKFAYYDPDRGATVNMSGVHDRPMPVFWNRLKVTDGSLLLTTIQWTDNGLKMKAKTHLRALSSKAGRGTRSSMETVDSKAIIIRVNTTQGLIQGTSISRNNQAATDRSALASSTPLSYPSVVTAALSTIVPAWFPPTQPSGASAVHGQLWIMSAMAAAAFLCIHLR